MDIFLSRAGRSFEGVKNVSFFLENLVRLLEIPVGAPARQHLQ